MSDIERITEACECGAVTLKGEFVKRDGTQAVTYTRRHTTECDLRTELARVEKERDEALGEQGNMEVAFEVQQRRAWKAEAERDVAVRERNETRELLTDWQSVQKAAHDRLAAERDEAWAAVKDEAEQTCIALAERDAAVAELARRDEQLIAEVALSAKRYEEIKNRDERIAAIRSVVDEQAENEVLWALNLDGSLSIGEAYLQQALRRLHGVVETTRSGNR